jgi:hypothetical protein
MGTSGKVGGRKELTVIDLVEGKAWIRAHEQDRPSIPSQFPEV